MSKLSTRARQWAAAREARSIPDELRQNWAEVSNPPTTVWSERLDRFRDEVIPWLHSTRPLAGQRLVEVGVGKGASTVALTEQGAQVTGIDLDADDLALARTSLAGCGLAAELHELNATEIASVMQDTDHIIYWASLEHMTVPERLLTLGAAWKALPAGGLLTVIETPNRLWPFDSHTSQLPFFSWLPSDLALRFSEHSPRATFRDLYVDVIPTEASLLDFQRRGHGLSFHEFAVAFECRPEQIEVVSCMQLARRKAAPYRQAGWTASAAGRTERELRHHAPDLSAAWFQPFLYLTIRRS